MKMLLGALLLVAMCVEAQTNAPVLTGIAISPSPTISNFNHIVLTVTNITPNQPYGLIISRRLPQFIPYITFVSSSNSTVIQRETTNGIPIRYYRVGPTNFVGNIVGDFSPDVSPWDDVDIPGDDEMFSMAAMCNEFLFDPQDRPESTISNEVLEIILPPPLKPSNNR